LRHSAQMPFNINDSQHNNILHQVPLGCVVSECRDLFIVMLNVVMLSVIMLNVFLASYLNLSQTHKIHSNL
jgi:hypothetical protein